MPKVKVWEKGRELSKKALYAGTFDPFTLGHQDIVRRAIKLFDELTIVVAVPPQKKPFLEADERVALIKELFKDNKNIKVDTWSGLTTDYAKKNNIDFLIRGLRPTGDFDNEFQMATFNNKLVDDLETVFLVTGEKYYYIASSYVKEIYNHGGDISQFVPENILKALQKKKG